MTIEGESADKFPVMEKALREQPSSTTTWPEVELFYFESVTNNLGVWDKSWYATKQEAEDARHEASCDGMQPVTDAEMTGEYGQLSEVRSVRVLLNRQGVLDLARVASDE